MKKRCDSPSNPAFKNYGGRGIKVCEEWRSFVGFLDWALTHGYDADLQIDRIDVDGPYCPANCRWISREINVKRRELSRDGSYLANLSGRLTQTAVTEAPSRGHPYKMPDADGLYLYVSRTGAKSWRYRYRLEDKERLLTLGRHPKLSIWAARELHAIARSQVDRGCNPAALKADRLKRKRREAQA